MCPPDRTDRNCDIDDALLDRRSCQNPTPGTYAHGAELARLRDTGEPDAASHLEQGAFAAGMYPHLRHSELDGDYGLLPDGTRSPAWGWADVVPPHGSGISC